MTPSKVSVALTLKELELFCRALAEAAEAGLLDRADTMRRIGELMSAGWKSEKKQADLAARISAGTRKGLERQRQTGQPGAKGHHGPGQPRKKFDHAQAILLKAQGMSNEKIAEACGVAKITIWRFFQEREKKSAVKPPH